MLACPCNATRRRQTVLQTRLKNMRLTKVFKVPLFTKIAQLALPKSINEALRPAEKFISYCSLISLGNNYAS